MWRRRSGLFADLNRSKRRHSAEYYPEAGFQPQLKGINRLRLNKVNLRNILISQRVVSAGSVTVHNYRRATSSLILY